ncbi:hypothetical protein AB0B94_30805 [Micromonospora sp. NPDC048986]|uniref:hypothetical protein n=1 Tax=Micromonospora sp. NPDC048986 TaxID=3155644 RepID=UPI0033E271FF
MDPISFLVTVLALYGILTRDPAARAEAVEEWGYAKRGEESPAAQDRRQRLVDAGFEPASTTKLMRRYVTNRVREYLVDRQVQRETEQIRKGADQAAGAAAESWRDRFDDAARRLVDQWRTDSDAPGDNTNTPDTDLPVTPRPRKPADDQSAGPDEDDEPITVVHDSDEYVYAGRTAPPPTDPFGYRATSTGADGNTHNSEDRGPIRVDATLGDPIADPAPPAAIEAPGGTMGNALAQQEVTGVVSGAGEARAIQRSLDTAVASFVAQLSQIRNRINQLGEQTLSNVQMSGRSQVVQYTAAAAEAAAAAQASANSCNAEVSPLLGNVARAFDRVNS